MNYFLQCVLFGVGFAFDLIDLPEGSFSQLAEYIEVSQIGLFLLHRKEYSLKNPTHLA